MRSGSRLLLLLFVLLAPILLLTTLPFGASPAFAALGDACTVSGQPGELDGGSPETCTPVSSPSVGTSCGADSYYNGAMCVADNDSCGNGIGTYSQGVCEPTPGPDAPTPESPTTPSGFGSVSGAASAPSGELQPMCVNASPFIGGGVFVVSGTVLCYTGAGRNTGIYAYTDDGAGAGGWNPFDPQTWDSMVMRDLYASDDVTAEGTLSVFGGAQIYSPNGQNGMQITDDGVLIRSGDASGNVATVTTTPGNAAISATNGTTTSSINVDGDDGVSVVGNVATGGPAVSINGTIGDTNAARTGVYVTGSGQGDATAPTVGGPAQWADVLIGSENFALSGGQPVGTGSGIIVNDYGVTIRSAAIGNTYNEFGHAGLAGSTVTNEIGTGEGGGATINRIGNTNADSRFEAVGGTSSVTVIQGALDFVTGQGASTLPSPTQAVSGGTATTMVGATGRYAVVDDIGRITMVEGVAPQATSAMYIENGYGTTNGFVATESATTMSGGETNPTSLVLDDNGAHWFNDITGAPIQVSGVADGTSAFDATNVRQLDSGLASVAALAGLPAPQVGKRNSFGFAFGHHDSGTALALGGQSLIGDSLTVKYGAAISHSNGLYDSSASLGLGMSW